MPRKTKSKFRREAERTALDVFRQIYEDFKGEFRDLLPKLRGMLVRRFLAAQKKFYGETVVILGPPAAGKTTLFKVLRDPSISPAALRAYKKTEYSDPQRAFRCKFKLSVTDDHQVPFDFKVRKTNDVGGELYLRDEKWQQAIRGCKLILYVADASRLLSDNSGLHSKYRARILSDFDWLLVNSQLPKANFSVLIAANKIDLLCSGAKAYEAFQDARQSDLDELVAEIRSKWKRGLRKNIRGATFLSLTDERLRTYTLDNVILCFMGGNLRDLYRRTKGVPANDAH
jgi:GTPase SAR1 family protein